MKTVFAVFAVLFAIWGLGIVSRDINTCKILNVDIIKGCRLLGLFVAVQVSVTIAASYGWLPAGFADNGFFAPSFYGAYALHVLFTAVMGILLWYADIWPAGDAKFFMVTGAMLPLMIPEIQGFPYRTFFYFLVNIFVAASFWAFGNFFLAGLQKLDKANFFGGVYHNFLEEITRIVKRYRGWQLLFVLSGMFIFFLVQRTVSLTVRLAAARIVSDPAVVFFVLFLLWDKISPLFQKKAWIIASGIFYVTFIILGVIYMPDRLIELAETAFIDSLKLSICIVALRRFAVFLMEQADLQLVYPEQIKPGMILSERSRILVMGDPNFGGEYNTFIKEGLTELQAQILRDNAVRMREKIPDFKYEIITGRPFAGWIMFGAILTLVFKENIAVMIFR
ncbi:MAG: hypothetical protein J6Z08_01545 [Elusimicrobiales bacterium]|nr:hypothetical protein [Elusimicrobiales bacterium]